MTIVRNVNGQEMEFELTWHEMYDAHTEYEFDCTMEDVKTQCEDDMPDITDEEVKKIANKALRYLSKNDLYYESYWDCVRQAIDDFIETEQNN